MIITQQTTKQSSPAPTTVMMLPQIFTGKVQAPCQEEGSYSFLIGGDNDDLIQEGMIALYKAIRAFKADRESSFVHYASLCIDNQLYNVIKGANRLKNSPLNTYVSLYSPLNSDTENNSRETLADTLQPSELINPEDIVIDKENVTDIESHIEKHLSKFEKKW